MIQRREERNSWRRQTALGVMLRPHGSTRSNDDWARAEEPQNTMIAVGFLCTSRLVTSRDFTGHESADGLRILRFVGRETSRGGTSCSRAASE